MTADTQLHTVRLVGVPTALWGESRKWFESLLREFAIVATESASGTPRQLVEFVAEVNEKFSRFSSDSNSTLENALAEGEAQVDLELALPAAAASAARDLWTHIQAADEYCRQGKLLTLQPKEDLRRFIEWYLNEVASQIDGDDPHAWGTVSQPSTR